MKKTALISSFKLTLTYHINAPATSNNKTNAAANSHRVVQTFINVCPNSYISPTLFPLNITPHIPGVLLAPKR